MKIKSKFEIIILLLVFAFTQPLSAQLDSIYNVLHSTTNDTVRMTGYEHLGTYYLNSNLDSSNFYLQKALAISQKLDLKLNEVSILNNVGIYYTYSRNYPKSLEILVTVIDIAKDPAIEKNVWNLPKGQTPNMARLRQLESGYRNIGSLYAFSGNWVYNTDKQIKNYREAKRIAETIKDSQGIAQTDLSLGITYTTANMGDSALIHIQKALAYFAHSDNKVVPGSVWKFLGDAYTIKRDKDLALDAFLKAVKIDRETNNKSNEGWAYNSLASLYSIYQMPDSAIYYSKLAVQIFKRINEPSGLVNAYDTLASSFDKKNARDSAFKYLKLLKPLSDSMNAAERKNILAFQDVAYDEQLKANNLEKERIRTQNKVRTYTLLTGILVFVLITGLLYRNNRHRKKTNDLLQKQKEEIEEQKNAVEKALIDLKATQSQLIQSEKMASLGELTAGIAHEIQNPLNFVNNFSEVSNEMMDEMNEELDKGDINEAKVIGSDIKQNLEKINHHGKRADAIVKSMLEHSRTSTGVKGPTDINKLADEYLRLAYHGLRAKNKSFNAEMKTDFDESIEKINVVPQDIGRVLLNLFNNAFYAVNEKQKETVNEEKNEKNILFQPTVWVITKNDGNRVTITVKDNGGGIPEKIKEKIFQPFFTTKPTGSGTGLGLSLSYDIIKAHGGEIKVETKEGEGTEFMIQLPVI